MRIPQISIMVDNKPGALLAPCQALSKAGINIVTLSLAEHRQYGTLRLIVADWEKARDLLEAAGFTSP